MFCVISFVMIQEAFTQDVLAKFVQLDFPSLQKELKTGIVDNEILEEIPILGLMYYSQNNRKDRYMESLEKYTKLYGAYMVLQIATDTLFYQQNKTDIQLTYFELSTKMVPEKWIYRELLQPYLGLHAIRQYVSIEQFNSLAKNTYEKMRNQLTNRSYLYYFEYPIIKQCEFELHCQEYNIPSQQIINLIIYQKALLMLLKN